MKNKNIIINIFILTVITTFALFSFNSVRYDNTVSESDIENAVVYAGPISIVLFIGAIIFIVFILILTFKKDNETIGGDLK